MQYRRGYYHVCVSWRQILHAKSPDSCGIYVAWPNGHTSDNGRVRTPSVARQPSGVAAHRVSRLTEEDLADLGVGVLLGRAIGLPYLIGLLHRRPVLHGLEPALHMGEIVEILPLPLPQHAPRIGRHIGNRIVAREVLAIGEAPVHHGIKPTGFLHITIDGVG